ncbi:hypothetical protein PENTCL1PPCAC_29478 [Pristionchus entomophagus]|uniref:Pleckstrin homology domain containing protein n=1 Tax=Pristionchus entomophagus TaxID=358040 RepID=A0AAV5ULT9_9BILA|nr:hypothetical protein PENTCL1PPCAC_29478 [Pristionchus entomophagus]
MFMSYQLAPVNLRPPLRVSASVHSTLAQRIEENVQILRDEREIVDGENKAAKELLQTMDAVFSHGLLSGSRCYWPFIKEFLPKNEHQLMEVEWSITHHGGLVTRVTRLSFAWLKDSFNRGSLYFQLLAILGSRKTVATFYHSAACLRNYGIFEMIVNQIALLENVQFAYKTDFRANGPLGGPRIYRSIPVASEEEPVARRNNVRPKAALVKRNGAGTAAGAAVVDGEVKAVRREEAPRKLEKVVPPPSSSPARAPIAARDVSQDVILKELLQRNKRNRIQQQHLFTGETAAEPIPRVVVDRSSVDGDDKPEERLDTVLQKTISQVRLEHVAGSFGKSFDQLLFNEKAMTSSSMDNGHGANGIGEEREQRRKQEKPIVGDIALHSGEVLRFAMDIFVDVEEGEKFQRLFHVFDGSPTEEKARLLLVTDRNLYLITQTIEDGQVGASSEDIQVEYHTHVVMPIPSIEYFEVTSCGLILTAYAAQSKSFHVAGNGTTNDRIVAMHTGDARLGQVVLDTIVQGVASLGGKPPSIETANTPFDLILRRFVTKQSLTSTEIRQMFVTFWTETPRTIKEDAVEPAYFIRREITRNWLGGTTGSEWQQSYFVLRDSKLYIFADSTCHDGQKIIDLSAVKELVVTEEAEMEHPNVISIALSDSSFMISFPSADDKNRWVHSIQAANCQIPESTLSSALLFVTDSHLVIGQLGSNAHVDGFIRTLVVFKLELVREALFYKTNTRTIILLGVEDNFEWFMLRTDEEVARFRSHFASLVKCYDLPDFPESSHLFSLIEQKTHKYPNIWAHSVFVTGNDALSDVEDNDD